MCYNDTLLYKTSQINNQIRKSIDHIIRHRCVCLDGKSHTRFQIVCASVCVRFVFVKFNLLYGGQNISLCSQSEAFSPQLKLAPCNFPTPCNYIRYWVKDKSESSKLHLPHAHIEYHRFYLANISNFDLRHLRQRTVYFCRDMRKIALRRAKVTANALDKRGKIVPQIWWNNWLFDFFLAWPVPLELFTENWLLCIYTSCRYLIFRFLLYSSCYMFRAFGRSFQLSYVLLDMFNWIVQYSQHVVVWHHLAGANHHRKIHG